MYNLQYSGIIISITTKLRNVLTLHGGLISTETNPYYQYFDPYFLSHTYTLNPFDETGEMRFLFMSPYTYALPTKIPFLENRMYITHRLEGKSYNYFVYMFLHNTL